MSQASVRITVEQMVFSGLNEPQARVAGRVFQEEMARLVEVRGVPRGLEHSSEQESLRVEGIDLGPQVRPERLGRDLAEASLAPAA